MLIPTTWKQAAARAGYLVLAVCLIVAIAKSTMFGVVVTLIAALLLVLVKDVGGIRSHIPGLNSSRVLWMASSWATVLTACVLVIIAAATLTRPRHQSQSPAPANNRALQSGAVERAAIVAPPAAAPGSTTGNTPPAASGLTTASQPAQQPLRTPIFSVNATEIGCNATPDVAARVVGRRSPGTVEAVDSVAALAGDAWYRESTRRCWVRDDAATLQLFDALGDALAYSATVRPALQVQQAQRIGDLEIAVRTAWLEDDPSRAGVRHLLLALQVSNRGSGAYDYDLNQSLKLAHSSAPPEATSIWSPALQAGNLKHSQSVDGFVSFEVVADTPISALQFQAGRGSSSKGTILLALKVDSQGMLVRSEETRSASKQGASVTKTLPGQDAASALDKFGTAQPIGGGCPGDFPIKATKDYRLYPTDHPRYLSAEPVRCYAQVAGAFRDGYKTAEQFRPEDIAKSIRDNQALVAGASVDDIHVVTDSGSGLVTVTVQPKSAANAGFYLKAASATSVVASKAIWTTYPEAQAIEVRVLGPVLNANGVQAAETMASTLVSRTTGEQFGYDALKSRVQHDSQQFFCLADGYSLNAAVWENIRPQGCLNALSKQAKTS